jgi:ABC-type transport system substrate-binding protein
MISPAAFPNGVETDPLTSNSCHLDWGVIEGTETLESVNCVGPTHVYGTGPFKFLSKDTEVVDGDVRDNTVVFQAFEDYWGGASAVKELQIIRYDTSDQVKADLLSGKLDVVW